MVLEDLKKALSGAIMDLNPAPIPGETIEFEEVTLGRSEVDNSKWVSYISAALKVAKTFEIHCWNEETVVRSVQDGTSLDRNPCAIRIMPNGENWKLK